MYRTWFGLAILIVIAGAQHERWVRNYDGPDNGDDWAYSIVHGRDGNLYATGFSEGTGTGRDFTVLSLTPTDSLRWVYRYNGPANGPDWGNAVVYGQDGNIYAAGVSAGPGTAQDFTVVSLTSDGRERWVYRVDGAGHSHDEAAAIVYGEDGHVYAAGVTTGVGSAADLTVVSLDSAGTERWTTKYDWTKGADWANCLIYGRDGNLYAGGYSHDSLTFKPCVVVSLTTGGSVRWAYRYATPGEIYSVVSDTDGNLCAAGVTGYGAAQNFTVIGVTPGGAERWDYKLNGTADSADVARAVICGSDGNLYAAGYCTNTGTGQDLTVVSLTSDGDERWVYRFEGMWEGAAWANALAWGLGRVIYVAGAAYNNTTSQDLTVICLAANGIERWVYQRDGTGHFYDVADAVAFGDDGNVYAAGHTWNNGTNYDFTLVGLDPQVGAQEPRPGACLNLMSVPTLQNRELAFALTLPAAGEVGLSLYTVAGARVMARNFCAPGGSSDWTFALPAVARGAYLVRIEAGRFGAQTSKLVWF